MAAPQNRDGSYRVFNEYRGKQRVFTVGRVTEAEAKRESEQVDYLLMRLGQGLIVLPAGVDIIEIVRQDGKANPTKEGALTPVAKLTPRLAPRPLPGDPRQGHARGADPRRHQAPPQAPRRRTRRGVPDR